MDFKKFKLKDISKNITDGEHNTVVDDVNGEYFLLSNKNILDGEVKLSTDDRKISKKTFDKINKRTKLEKGDLVISTVGTLGKIAKIIDEPNYDFQRSVGMIKPNTELVDTDYLSYFLQQDYIQKKLTCGSAGAIQKCIYIDQLKNLVVEIEEDIAEQKRIAKVLTDIDSKIALNKKINKELETMAKEIYDYWFVQFDFPNAQGKPYKSSGGKMVYNPLLKREIPEGWEVKTLLDIATFTNGLACQKFRPTDENKKLPVIKIREMHDGITEDTEWVKSDISESVKVYNGDVLFSWSATLEVLLWCYGNGGLNQHIFKVTSNNGYPKSFYYFQLQEYIKVFKRMAEARKTTMGHITQDHLEQSQIVVPDNMDILNQFEKLIQPIFRKLVLNNEEISKYNQLRNELLPLLMNGQVRVKE